MSTSQWLQVIGTIYMEKIIILNSAAPFLLPSKILGNFDEPIVAVNPSTHCLTVSDHHSKQCQASIVACSQRTIVFVYVTPVPRFL